MFRRKSSLIRAGFLLLQVSQGYLPTIPAPSTTTWNAGTEAGLVRLHASSGLSSQIFLTHAQLKADFSDGTNHTVKEILGTPNATKLHIPRARFHSLIKIAKHRVSRQGILQVVKKFLNHCMITSELV